MLIFLESCFSNVCAKKNLQESLEVRKITAESAKASITSSGLQCPQSEKVKLFLKRHK